MNFENSQFALPPIRAATWGNLAFGNLGFARDQRKRAKPLVDLGQMSHLERKAGNRFRKKIY